MSEGQIARGALFSGIGTVGSRVLGAVRDVAIANVLGAGLASDAFWVAFTVPSIFRRFVADEGLTGALIPAVAEAEEEEGQEAARGLAGAALVTLVVAGFVLCLAGWVAAPLLVRLCAWGFVDNPEQFDLCVRLTRWMFPFVLFVSLVSWCEGLLNLRGHFFVPKLAPGVVSAAMVVALLLGKGAMPATSALALGVLVGGLAHVLVCLPKLFSLWGRPQPNIEAMRTARFQAFLGEMGKVVAIGVFGQLNVILLRLVASLLETGSVTHYWYANRVVDLSQGAIAVAVGSALLPEIARAAKAGDWVEFENDFVSAARLAALALIPAAIVLAFVAEPIVAMLFRHGAFGTDDLAATSATLQMLLPFMLAMAAIQLVKKVYFAVDDRNTLLAVGGIGVALTGGLGYTLSQAHGVRGLGMALSISAVIQMGLYIVLLRRHESVQLGLRRLRSPLLRMALASLPAAALAGTLAQYGTWSEGPSWTNAAVLATCLIGAVLVYGVGIWTLGVRDELSLVLRRFRPGR